MDWIFKIVRNYGGPALKSGLGLMLLVCLSNCVELGKIFQGNTKRRFGEYDIEDRQQYRKYLDNRARSRQQRDREILRRISQTEERVLRDDEDDSPARAALDPNLRAASGGPGGPSESRLATVIRSQKKQKRNSDYPWIVRMLRRLFRAND